MRPLSVQGSPCRTCGRRRSGARRTQQRIAIDGVSVAYLDACEPCAVALRRRGYFLLTIERLLNPSAAADLTAAA